MTAKINHGHSPPLASTGLDCKGGKKGAMPAWLGVRIGFFPHISADSPHNNGHRNEVWALKMCSCLGGAPVHTQTSLRVCS
mmetsp:Transcript_70526/g.117827  ORF Transcript_70526/g.117827 Transcript_70526/m.117827 type:complete len:81 (-) Transcript_70526:887-1129(-)